MAKKVSIMKLSKQFGSNSAGEICGFTPDTAAHIVENKGGKVLAEIDPKTERYDVDLAKVVPLKPEPAPKPNDPKPKQ